MRLLVITPHLQPDTAPTGVVVTAIVDRLGDLGQWNPRIRADVVFAPGRVGHCPGQMLSVWVSCTSVEADF